MAHNEQGKFCKMSNKTSVWRRAVFCGLLATSTLPVVVPSSAGAEASATNERMRIVQPDAAPKLAGLSMPGRYTLVILSPPFGECAPCDRLWAQLSEIKDLKIDVVKVQIDDNLPRPKILAEARGLIYSSMELAEGSEISYPLGVMLDPNGVVVQATFGKPRIDKKLNEIFTALAGNGPSTSTSGSTTPTTSGSTTPPPPPDSARGGVALAPTATPSDPKLAAVAIGIGAVAGGLFMVAVSSAVLHQKRGSVQESLHCDADRRCDAVGLALVAKERRVQDVSAAAWVMIGAGSLVAAEAIALMIYERTAPAGAVGVVGRVNTTGIGLAVEGKF
jgi:hypothetical protein